MLELYGTIAEETWFEDDVTPALFKEELMSGSGPTVFGIFDNRDKMAAAARSLRKSGLAKTVFATDIYNRDGGVTNDK